MNVFLRKYFFFNSYLNYEFEIFIFKKFSEINIFSKKNIAIFSNSTLDRKFYINIRILSKKSKNIIFINNNCNATHYIYSFLSKDDIIIDKNILFFSVTKLNIKHINIIIKIFNINNISNNILFELLKNKFFYVSNVLFIIIDNNWDITYNQVISHNFKIIIFYYNDNLYNILEKYIIDQKNLLYSFRLKNYLLK